MNLILYTKLNPVCLIIDLKEKNCYLEKKIVFLI